MTRIKDILLIILFLAMLVGTGMMQTHLKEKPQLGMMFLGAFTLVAFILKTKTVSTGLFYLLIGMLLFVNYFMITDWIIHFVNPNRNWVVVNGIKHPTMDFSWIWGVIAGLILSPVTIVLYHKNNRRNQFIEIATTVLFLMVTISIYFRYEVL